MRGSDLGLVARRIANAGAPAEIGSTAVSAELARALVEKPNGGSYVARTAMDGIERANAYRRVGRHPLLVLLLIATPADMAIPLPGRTGEVPLHVVPLDFVVRAAHAIGRHPSSPGRTFHLADPSPPSARR